MNIRQQIISALEQNLSEELNSGSYEIYTDSKGNPCVEVLFGYDEPEIYNTIKEVLKNFPRHHCIHNQGQKTFCIIDTPALTPSSPKEMDKPSTAQLVEALEKLTGKKVVLKEDYIGDAKAKFYCLNTRSKINTKDPLKNDLVSTFKERYKSNPSEEQMYFLISTRKYQNPIIIAGHSSKLNVNDKVALYDDINQTTKFSKGMVRAYWDKSKWISNPDGDLGTVLAIAHGAEEIKSFPQGIYTLMVLK